MSPPSRELGVSRTVTALSRAVSSVLTSNAGKEQRLPGSSAYSRGCSHGKGDCRKCGFGGRGRTTIPAAAACSFSAFSRSYLSPKRYAPADGQTVNLGIIFGLFSPCVPHLRNGRYENVFLTESEYAELLRDFPDRLDRLISELSSYMESTGRSYQNHAATIRRWAENDKTKGVPKQGIPDYTCKEGESL